MINRVQAFNNKNNYNQNFGMALKFKTAEAKVKLNHYLNCVSPTTSNAAVAELEAIEKVRFNDIHADMLIQETIGGNLEVTLIHRKGHKIPGTTNNITMPVDATNLDVVMKPIRATNVEAEALQKLSADPTRAIPVEF